MNEFFAGVQGGDIVFLRQVPQVLTVEQAVDLAVMLAVLADPSGKQFQDKLRRMQEGA